MSSQHICPVLLWMGLTLTIRYKGFMGFVNLKMDYFIRSFVRVALVSLLSMTLVHQPGFVSSQPGDRRCIDPKLAECECRTESNQVTLVNCTNVGFTNHSALTHMPTSAKEIIFVGNDIMELPPNVLGTSTGHGGSCRQMHNLKVLDMSRNHVNTIHGKTFHCMPGLESLTLDSNDWFLGRVSHSGVFSNFQALKKLSLRNTFDAYNDTLYILTKLSEVFNNSKLDHLQDLDISDNDLWFFSPDLFRDLRGLVRLRLNDNNIATPRLNYRTLDKLEELYLQRNSISSLSRSFMESLSHFQSLKDVYLSGNPFQCDCDLIRTHRWLLGLDGNTSFLVKDKDELKCEMPVSLSNRTLLSLKEKELTCPKPIDLDGVLRAPYVIIGCVFGILVILFIVVMYLNRRKVLDKCNNHVVEPIRESILGRDIHHGYASVTV